MDSPGPVDYDAELRLHDEVLRRACGVQPHEQVLDIGCGLGQTTCEAARLARAGSVLGVDISGPAIERARELAQAQAVAGILEAAGFADVAFTDVNEPVYYGPDVAAALEWIRGFACTSEALNRLDPAAAARALGRLREMLAAHLSGNGVWFDSRAWIVTARRHC
jgi:SAM-dependent methyltransferase